MSSVAGGETAPSSGRTSGETGLVDPPSPSSVIIPDSSGSEESLALVINRVERVPLPEGRMDGGRLVAELPDAPEGATTAVNPCSRTALGWPRAGGVGLFPAPPLLRGTQRRAVSSRRPSPRGLARRVASRCPVQHWNLQVLLPLARQRFWQRAWKPWAGRPGQLGQAPKRITLCVFYLSGTHGVWVVILAVGDREFGSAGEPGEVAGRVPGVPNYSAGN